MRMRYYDFNIYKLGNEYKIVYLNRFYNDEPYVKKEYINKMVNDKWLSNISRAKSSILGYALCNDWQYFCTFTLDKTKYDRFDLKTWSKDFSQYLRNQKRLHNLDISYLLIPELHKDGAWHMHGLINGIAWDDLLLFERYVHPDILVDKGYRYHKGILDKFGFNSFGKVKNKAAVSRYILKYVSKSINNTSINKGYRLFYNSQGLNKPELIESGCTSCHLTDIDYENDFMSTKWITDYEVKNIMEYFNGKND